jgi:RimJ/RimL family protein N-acetyltransferase
MDLSPTTLEGSTISAVNERSRTALTRLGVVEEGILRHHTVNADGSLRDSVYFSILAEET